MLSSQPLSIFVTLEGIEGCGKTTQAPRLVRRLKREGYDALLTREPGGTAIGKEIRQIILNPRHRAMCAETELALYFSDRAQHLRQVVWPALDEGKIVVSDRFTDSTIAYQGHGRGLPLKLIRALDRTLTGSFRPDVTLLLELGAEQGLARARSRNQQSVSHRREGRFEDEAMAFHERVRRGYHRLARAEPARFVWISADGPPKAVHEEIWTALKKTRRLPSRKRRSS